MDRIVEHLLAVKSPAYKEVVKELTQEVKEVVKRYAECWFERKLEAELLRWLGREPYVRRDRLSGRRLPVSCPQCGSSYLRDFSRNGRRRRHLLTQYGLLEIWLPRVRCQCGGSVPIPFEVLPRWRHVWHDLQWQVQDWADKALSLRQMQQDLAQTLDTSMGLRTLNEWVHDIRELPKASHPFSTVPPVVLLDAIWVTQLVDQETTCSDSLGRVRPVKKKQRGAVLIALGVWPHTGRYHILDWELAAGESGAEWDKLLGRLIRRQLWQTRGLQLLVHDGGSGLKAALQRWYHEVPSQRCVFHKLRNVWQAIVVPDPVPHLLR
jgi:hypothetical protein